MMAMTTSSSINVKPPRQTPSRREARAVTDTPLPRPALLELSACLAGELRVVIGDSIGILLPGHFADFVHRMNCSGDMSIRKRDGDLGHWARVNAVAKKYMKIVLNKAVLSSYY